MPRTSPAMAMPGRRASLARFLIWLSATPPKMTARIDGTKTKQVDDADDAEHQRRDGEPAGAPGAGAGWP